MPTFLAIKNPVFQLHILDVTALGAGFRTGIPAIYQFKFCSVVGLLVDELTTDFVEAFVTNGISQLVVSNHT
jgi:hypothetical protein